MSSAAGGESGSWGTPPSAVVAAAGTEPVRRPCDFSLLSSPSASSPKPSDVVPGAAGHHPAAGADSAGPAGADADSQWHAADPRPSHGADGGRAPGAAGPGRWLTGIQGGTAWVRRLVFGRRCGLHAKKDPQSVREPLVGWVLAPGPCEAPVSWVWRPG